MNQSLHAVKEQQQILQVLGHVTFPPLSQSAPKLSNAPNGDSNAEHSVLTDPEMPLLPSAWKVTNFFNAV